MAEYEWRCPGCSTYLELRKRVTLTQRRCPECGYPITPHEIDRQRDAAPERARVDQQQTRVLFLVWGAEAAGEIEWLTSEPERAGEIEAGPDATDPVSDPEPRTPIDNGTPPPPLSVAVKARRLAGAIEDVRRSLGPERFAAWKQAAFGDRWPSIRESPAAFREAAEAAREIERLQVEAAVRDLWRRRPDPPGG